jgi:nitrogen fixation protein
MHVDIKRSRHGNLTNYTRKKKKQEQELAFKVKQETNNMSALYKKNPKMIKLRNKPRRCH